MPRDIPVGNGQLLVNFDQHYQIRDIYFPHVGQENHAGGGPCRFGVFASIPPTEINRGDRRQRRLYWSSQNWKINLLYHPDTLASDVTLQSDHVALTLHCTDVVDFHRPVFVRRIDIHNHHDSRRQVTLFHHNNFNMYGTKIGDTVYFDPQRRCLIHYRKNRYLMATWHLLGEQRIDQYATGTAGYFGAEGTWRDAEDGILGNNPIAQGAVDSTMMLRVQVPPLGKQTCYMLIGAGEDLAQIHDLHRFIHREGPQGIIDRTTAYWRLWVSAAHNGFAPPKEQGPSPKVVDLYKRSLLVIRSQVDDSGAIIAANDSDIMQFSRDTYSYLWPRDGALVASALDDAGLPAVSQSFFRLSSRIISDGGYFLHKYNPDGSPASSWHPWSSLGKPQLPIQEDETALVLWALWRHFVIYRDIEFVRTLWVNLITKAADFLVRFTDPDTGLPLPSYDLWEERWGTHAFTVATTYAGLRAAQNFAACFGDHQRGQLYAETAGKMRDAFNRFLWSESHGRFLRRIVPLDHDRTARLMAQVLEGRQPQNRTSENDFPRRGGNGQADPAAHLEWELDPAIDSSLYAIFAFGLLDPRDPRVERTMKAVEDRLWIKTSVGGMARYEADGYHRISDRTDLVAGNPWFICTLWLAQWHIARARNLEELRKALPIFDWAAEHALPSCILAEQVHPHTNAPLSVSPLTWSHATVVSALLAYHQKQLLLKQNSPDALACTGFADPTRRDLFHRSPLPPLDAELLPDDGSHTPAATAKIHSTA
ncbi:MAG: glycoside hydrolase family 15 protein [Phycisphaeraceae bacterium]|nr:glycoside hydrolase family 15 protein [Phycisphaeraceae bacterium]